MSTSLIFVVLACCCFGQSSGAVDKPTLVITHTPTDVKLTCTTTTQSATFADYEATFNKDDAADKYIADTVDGVAITGSGSTNTVAVKTLTQTSFGTSDFGKWTCKIKDDGSPALESEASVAVVYTACSSAPRTVDSLALALVCLLATVVKSKLC